MLYGAVIAALAIGFVAGRFKRSLPKDEVDAMAVTIFGRGGLSGGMQKCHKNTAIAALRYAKEIYKVGS